MKKVKHYVAYNINEDLCYEGTIYDLEKYLRMSKTYIYMAFYQNGTIRGFTIREKNNENRKNGTK